MKTPAAVLVELKKPLELVDLELPPLKAGQVLVEIAYSGVCHTQVLEARGHRGEDKFLPHCLGHEGSGTVCEVGAGVTKVKPGDRAILSWIKGSGADIPGTVYGWNGRNVNSGAITTFSKYSVISENRLTVLPQDFSMRSAVLLGCAIPTGVGTVFNTTQPRPGQSLVVFGAGGVGLCAIAGAAISGCVPVIAVDILPEKLELARMMGATHVVNSKETSAVDEILRICPGGADFAIEVTGWPAVMQQAVLAVRNQGGVAVVIGNARFGEKLEIDPKQFNLGKQMRGTWGGDNWPDRDYPRYCKLMAAKRINVEPLLSRSYKLTEINQALDDLEQGKAARPLIDMS
jgi:S-(hydroxymethyl)glutathione dehydrogenase / alcohol dehydrogenase